MPRRAAADTGPGRDTRSRRSNGRRSRAHEPEDELVLAAVSSPQAASVMSELEAELEGELGEGHGEMEVEPDGEDGGMSGSDIDVDDEIDELLSDGDERDAGAKEQRSWDCKWKDCGAVAESQDDLVKHITTDHVGAGRQPYACLWTTCKRVGQKQASRHALLTHIRSHTGEKPYSCPEPDCGRTFTRSDAMNKHVRSVHSAQRKRRGGAAAEAVEDDVSTAIRDLAKDPDLEEVVLRVRGRARDRIVAQTADEEARLQYVRDRRPGAGKKRRIRKKDGSDSDEFDEGASKRYPLERTVVTYMLDQDRETEVPVMSRSRWQAKYIMAKAKLMLVDEENKMRRDEYAFWEALYQQEIGPLPGADPEADADPEAEAEDERPPPAARLASHPHSDAPDSHPPPQPRGRGGRGGRGGRRRESRRESDRPRRERERERERERDDRPVDDEIGDMLSD